MKISSLSLPHPVLGIHDDVSGLYNASLDVTLSEEEIVLKTSHTLENDSISKMLDANQAAFSVQISCPKTFYRRNFNTTEKELIIKIPSHDLRDKVNVDFYIVATTNISDYKLNGEHSDYQGYAINVEKGDVISFGGSADFIAAKSWRALKAVSSFIEIQPSEEENGPNKYDLSGNKIIIELSKSDYRRFRESHNNSRFEAIFHSSLVYPVIVYALSQMISDSDRDNYKDLSWFEILDYRINHDETFRNISFDAANIPLIAQLLIDNPLNRTLEAVQNLMITDD